MDNKEFNQLFRKRTKKFAVDVIRFLEHVPFNTATKVMAYQLCKSATSVGANFRAFCKSRSKNERFAKICIVVEEADETIYWLGIFEETYAAPGDLVKLLEESNEFLKITASIKNNMFPV